MTKHSIILVALSISNFLILRRPCHMVLSKTQLIVYPIMIIKDVLFDAQNTTIEGMDEKKLRMLRFDFKQGNFEVISRC